MKRLTMIGLAVMLIAVLLAGCGKKVELPTEAPTHAPTKEEKPSKTEEATQEKTTEADETKEIETEAPTEAPAIVNNEQVVVEMEKCFAEELDYIVPDEELEPSSMMTNAILKKTTVTVNAADKNWCDVTICYPNALDVLLEVADALPEDADWDQIDEAYIQIAAIIESDEVEMLEENFVLPVTNEYGYYDIVWSDEAINALSGGLYLIGME